MFPPKSYLESIIDLLGDAEAIDVLQQTAQELEQCYLTLVEIEDGFERSYGKGKWTAKQIFAHLADTDLLMGYRIRQAISVENYVIDIVDQDGWAKPYHRLDASLALQSFRGLRAWNLALISTFGLKDWVAETMHPERPGKFDTVDTLVRFLAGHDLNHLAQLERIIQGPSLQA